MAVDTAKGGEVQNDCKNDAEMQSPTEKENTVGAINEQNSEGTYMENKEGTDN